MTTLFLVGAFAVIFDEERRVLLSHRRDMDMWNLPGGQMEPGETPVETVVREVEEETGLNVAVVRLVSVYTKREQDQLVFTFTCRCEGGELVLTSEADEHCYFSLEEIPSNTLSRHRIFISHALKEDGQPIFEGEG